MASPGPLTPCASPSRTARLSLQCPSTATSPVRLALSSLASRSQKQGTSRRRLYISTAAAATPAAACSPSSGSFSPCSPGLHLKLPGPAFLTLTPSGCVATRFGSCICRNAPAGGATGPSGGSSSGETQENDSADALMQSSGALSRAMSPISTAEQPNAAFDSISSSSSSSMMPGMSQQGLDSSPETSEVQLLNPAAAAAVALPGVGSSSASSIASALTATAAAAAAAEAAVAGALDLQTGHALGATGGPSAAGELQDLFTLLKMQVRNIFGSRGCVCHCSWEYQ